MPAGVEKEPHPDERDLELENMFGNYLIAQFQASRLMGFFQEKLAEAKHDSEGRPTLLSAHTFKFNGKWYRASLVIRQISVNDLIAKD